MNDLNSGQSSKDKMEIALFNVLTYLLRNDP